MSEKIMMTLWLQAFGDLLKRYGAAFLHAWQCRTETDFTHRLPYEVQFLPAALSLQETPVSPAPRLAMLMLIVFTVLALLWATFGKIDVVATAQGKVVPNGRIKTIQPIETAAVKAIHVTDGQSVKTGDVLIELDGTTAQADKNRIMGDLVEARLQVVRGKAVISALDRGKIPSLQKSADVDEAKF